jgi:hypothetical protein
MKLFGMTFSRRTLFQKAGLTVGVGLLDLAAAEDAPSQISEHNRASGKPRALALIGDRYHNPDYIRVSLDKVFKELNIPIDYTIQYDQISRSLLKNYQLFLCLRDGMIWPDGYLGPDAYTSYEHDLENPAQFSEPKPETWMTEEQGAAIKEFVNAGNGFYALHNCSHISLSSKNYRDVMGGACRSVPFASGLQKTSILSPKVLVSSWLTTSSITWTSIRIANISSLKRRTSMDWSTKITGLSRLQAGLMTSARDVWSLPQPVTRFTPCGSSSI